MKPVSILLVEDNEGDIMLTREALEDAKIWVELSVVKDGKEAIDLLNQQGKYADTVLPDMLLLDVNLPKKNGHEVLQYIKENDNLKHIPVIMLTTSSSQKDMELCHKYNANGYITKPLDVDELLAVVAGIKNLGLSIVKLPANNINHNG